MLHHLLPALDYLASKDMIHRDVKPRNILYSFLPGGGYHYQLADFGIAKLANDTRTAVGTEIFKAPEVGFGLEQTTKMDVWSIFATYLWGTCSKPFQATLYRLYGLARITEISETSKAGEYRHISAMTFINAAESVGWRNARAPLRRKRPYYGASDLCCPRRGGWAGSRTGDDNYRVGYCAERDGAGF